jgi:hypothetical protein
MGIQEPQPGIFTNQSFDSAEEGGREVHDNSNIGTVGSYLTRVTGLSILSVLAWLWEALMLRSRNSTPKNKLHGLSPRANYTDRATAACRRSDCQLLRIKGAMWSA